VPSQRGKRRLSSEIANELKVAMQALKQYGGLNPSRNRAAIRGVGKVMGSEFARWMVARNSTQSPSVGDKSQLLVADLSSFWKDNGIGEMKVVDEEPLTIGIERCHDCLGWMTGVGVAVCPFKEGFLEAVFDDVLESKHSVEEIECCGTLAPCCKFEVTKGELSKPR
jgi:predicted hydrocarbon binding protein